MAPPYSARISPILPLPVWQSLVGFRLLCTTPSKGWVKYPVLFYAVCRPKFMKFSDDVWDLLYFPTPLPDCLCHVVFRR